MDKRSVILNVSGPQLLKMMLLLSFGGGSSCQVYRFPSIVGDQGLARHGLRLYVGVGSPASVPECGFVVQIGYVLIRNWFRLVFGGAACTQKPAWANFELKQTIRTIIDTQAGILNSGFWIPGRSRTPPNPARDGRNRTHWARGELEFSWGMSTTWSPDWQAEVGDHFGHPAGAQVTWLNSEETHTETVQAYGKGADTDTP